MKFQLALSASTAKHSRLLSKSLEGQFTSFISITKQHCRLKAGLKTHSISFALTLNQRHRLRECLETQLVSTNSTFFEIDFNIPGLTPSSAELSEIDYSLWHGHRRRAEIKILTLTICSHYKYIWGVIACIIITGKRHARPDIWPETPEQVKNIEDMIRTIWSKEVYHKQKASGTKIYLLALSGKEAGHIYLFC